MRAQRGAEQIMRGVHVGHPVAHGFADGVLERAAAVGDADHFRAQQAHAEDVEALAAHVLFAHVDDAFEAEQRAHGRRGDAVLSRAGFGDDALLAHAPGEQRLPQAVVDLVRAGVQQVFALEINLRAAQRFAQALREVQRRGAAGVVRSADRRARPETAGSARGCAIGAAPALRAGPSELREQSVRRRGRSVRWNRVAK